METKEAQGGTHGNNNDLNEEDQARRPRRVAGGVLPDITAAIGGTPLVELSRLAKHYALSKSGGRILAKLEYLNPGFSKKDRIAKQIVLDAKNSGELKPGQTVVELTSGNTGTGLAIVCGVMGHPFIAVMSAGNTMERARMMRSLGADVVIVDQAAGSVAGQVSGEDLLLVEEKTKELVKEHAAFRADQFVREGNAKAHFTGTAPEIWEASGGSVTAFCDFVGTGGSFGGCASYFRSKDVKSYVIEPVGAAILSGKEVTRASHRIQGGGYVMKKLSALMNESSTSSKFSSDYNEKTSPSHPPSSSSTSLIDGYLEVTDEQAIQAARDLAKFEGIYGGFSAGANVAGAIELLKTLHVGGTVAVLICDSGLKYLSTDLWE